MTVAGIDGIVHILARGAAAHTQAVRAGVTLAAGTDANNAWVAPGEIVWCRTQGTVVRVAAEAKEAV